jgi:uncharacterized protein YPO0396
MGEATIDRAQVRLTRLQIVNWGTFSGYKDLPISRQGVLFTGPSGSGKSSLLDAHSAVLLPTVDQRFNASADLTARGSKQSTRNAAAYVRGAWSETNDEYDQSQVRYLRAGKPTWSAVGATYNDGMGVVTTAVVVRWFTGSDTDGASLKTMHHLHGGDFDLPVLNEWAERGFDTGWFKRTYPPLCRTADQTTYLRELRARLRMGTSHHALALLGKAKAMKNVGDLNLFIRDNMLDEPETFAAAERMLSLFQPLNEAHRTAERAYHQSRVLAELPELWTRYEEGRAIRNLAESLLGEPTEVYLRQVYVEALRRELDAIDLRVSELDDLWQAQSRAADVAQSEYERLDRQFQREGSALAQLVAALPGVLTEVDLRRRAYKVYSGLITTRLGLPVPPDEAAFDAVLAQLPDIGDEANRAIPEAENIRTEALGQHAVAVRGHKAALDDLVALQSASNLIPSREAQRRAAIAAGTGVALVDLPYAAELIDVAPEEERWRPAAEKVVRGFGLRLLVPERHKDVVRRFIDENDMRGIVEYSIVTPTSSHRSTARANTLASKLTIDRQHPAGHWLAGQVATRFEHVCVETARELEPHRLAVTVRGTVKMTNNHYRKDDRPELASPSSYILGANTAAKRAALKVEVDRLAAQVVLHREAAGKADTELQNLTARVSAVEELLGYNAWTDIDHAEAVSRARSIEAEIKSIKADNVDLRQLEENRDTALEEWKKRLQVSGATRRLIEDTGIRQSGFADVLEVEDRKPHQIVDQDHLEFLDKVLAAVGGPQLPEDMGRLRPAFRRELDQWRKNADGERKGAESKISNAIALFNAQWPDAALDTTGDVDRCGQDYVALYEDIVQRRLHEAMEKFKRIISEDMVPSVAVLQRAIETSATQIRQRVEMVNKALERAQFNPGTFLQIAYKATVAEDVKDFRTQVDELLRNAAAGRRGNQESLAQFQRVQRLMTAFTTDSTEAKRWRANVLDVRNVFAFYAREIDHEGITRATHSNTAVNSGGEQEKLVAFCLAAALSYNLADSGSNGTPRFAPLMLDEAFSKSDEEYAAQALAVFDEFGFQLVMAAPIRMSGIVEPFIGQAVLVEKRVTADGARSNAASATFGELAARRASDHDEGARANT